ncbi:MAG: hybrid sensor histidine kinase/response regulator, partial [Muribaculaceae bacterium]|nr:hybrid sensor histidine kinase/response regulator [Muribaculaceae bacterium]
MNRFSHTMTAMLLAFLSASAGLYGANISNLGMMSGLSNGYVTSITQDPSGYVWVATEDGLNRFDGRRFVTFNKKNSGLGADELNCVAQIPSDPDRLWIATQRNGMYLYTHSTGIISRFEAPGIDHNAITSISPAKNSGMWLTNFHSGVHYYN